MEIKTIGCIFFLSAIKSITIVMIKVSKLKPIFPWLAVRMVVFAITRAEDNIRPATTGRIPMNICFIMGWSLYLKKKPDIKSMSSSEGSATPKVADTAPRIPAVL